MRFINEEIVEDKRIIEERIRRYPIIGFDDYPFKEIFNSHPDILMDVVHLITGINFVLDDFQIAVNELKDGITFKGMVCDIRVLAKTSAYEYEIDLEADQRRMNDDDMFDRAVLSASKMYSDLHERGSKYKGNKSSIVILFLNNKYNESKTDIEKIPLIKSLLTDYDKNKIIRTHNNVIIYSINVNSAIKNGFNFEGENAKILLEIVKVLATKEIDKFLNSKDEVVRTMAAEIKRINESDVEREKAFQIEFEKALNEFTINSSIREGYNAGLTEGEEIGLEKGRQKGIEESQKEVALELKNEGFDSSFIAKILKIDVKKVEELLAENK